MYRDEKSHTAVGMRQIDEPDCINLLSISGILLDQNIHFEKCTKTIIITMNKTLCAGNELCIDMRSASSL